VSKVRYVFIKEESQDVIVKVDEIADYYVISAISLFQSFYVNIEGLKLEKWLRWCVTMWKILITVMCHEICRK